MISDFVIFYPGTLEKYENNDSFIRFPRYSFRFLPETLDSSKHVPRYSVTTAVTFKNDVYAWLLIRNPSTYTTSFTAVLLVTRLSSCGLADMASFGTAQSEFSSFERSLVTCDWFSSVICYFGLFVSVVVRTCPSEWKHGLMACMCLPLRDRRIYPIEADSVLVVIVVFLSSYWISRLSPLHTGAHFSSFDCCIDCVAYFILHFEKNSRMSTWDREVFSYRRVLI